MKTLITLLLSLAFALPCYAEIHQFENEFTKSKIFISANERSKSENHSETFNTIALRKEIIKEVPSYKLFLMTSMSKCPSALDTTNFKFNNNDILFLPTTVDYNATPRAAAYGLDKEFLNKVLLATSLQVQMPTFTHKETQIKYTEYAVPPNVLEEWKQVITME